MSTGKKKKPYGTAAITGALSIASYIILFSNIDTVMDYFTRGGYYAALPILTVLYFSFVHGAFASSVISLSGLEPAKSNH